MPTTNTEYPVTSDRSRGWLRYLYRKATTLDNGDKNGHPHPHWDGTTGEPMLSWHRFDLIESSYAMALMADTTPAWRDVYGTILNELASRYTSYWAAKDWLDQLGPDPRRTTYPEGIIDEEPSDSWRMVDGDLEIITTGGAGQTETLAVAERYGMIRFLLDTDRYSPGCGYSHQKH